jgi:hypothetical protein
LAIARSAHLAPAAGDRVARFRLAPLVVIAWAAVTAAAFIGGPKVIDSMSIDDFMRLVQVRDLLNGQSWFDLVQHRLDPPAGVAMHWSRLVDLPIATLIYLLTPLVGRAGAEIAAAALWPPLLFLPTIALAGLLARRLAGEIAALATVMLVAVSAPAIVHFRAGAFDHHGLQLLLVLAATYGATARTDARWEPLLGGLAAAASIAVGLEMLPAVAAVLAGLGLRWAMGGAPAGRAMSSFGLAFGCGAALLLAATAPPSAWSAPVCDAISMPWIGAAALAGGTMALLARATPRLPAVKSRLVVGVAAGLIATGIVAFGFSDCLRDPYADMDPRMAALWLAHVSEVQNALEVMGNTPAEFLPIYGPLLVALVLGAIVALRAAPSERTLYLPPLLALAALTAVALWEVRGASSANLVAQPLIAAAIVRLLADRARVVMLASLLAVSSPVLVLAGEGAGAIVKAVDPGRPAYMENGPGACRHFADVAPLGRLAPGVVVSFVDLGPAILAGSGHAILAAPYHRNRAGNTAAFDVLVGDEAVARRALAEKHVDYVAVCPGSPERVNFERAAPNGLAARLSRAEVPAFLQRMPGDAAEPLWVFRVKR